MFIELKEDIWKDLTHANVANFCNNWNLISHRKICPMRGLQRAFGVSRPFNDVHQEELGGECEDDDVETADVTQRITINEYQSSLAS